MLCLAPEAYLSIVRYMFIVGSISEVCWLTIIHAPPEERAMRQRGIRCWAAYVNVTFNLFLEVWDFCNLNQLFEATWSPYAAASKQKNQEYSNSNYWIRAWQHWIKVPGPLWKTSFWWIEACTCNWSKNNFDEIQISQGLDWHFTPWDIFLSWPPPSINDVIWTDQGGKVEEKTWKLHSFLNGYTDTRELKQPQWRW